MSRRWVLERRGNQWGLDRLRAAREGVPLADRREEEGEGVSQSPPHSPHSDPMEDSQSLSLSPHCAEQTSLTL